MNDDKRQEIKTHDLHFASYLKAKKCVIIEVQKQGVKTIFTFDVVCSGLKISELKDGYFNNLDDDKFFVSAGSYADSIRALKTLCHIDESNDMLLTPDLYFAAYLKTKRCVIKKVNKDNGKTTFVFDVTQSGMSMLELKLGYFNNIEKAKYAVNASDYTDSVRSLKTMCHISIE